MMFDSIWMLAILPVAAWVLMGVVLLIVHVLHSPSTTERYSRRWNLLGLVAGLLVFIPVSEAGEWSMPWLRFYWHRSAYDAIVAAVQRGESPPPSAVDYQVDPGPPLRVAFPWPGGVVDSWCGAVYDSTGEILRINGLVLGSSAWRADPITSLFGGDMVACKKLVAPYYRCCFT